ncbi:metal ABC transporter permease [Bacillus sp. HMF5848]|uniref:metal ABC transporter permease n=1 Tax=Bacillus sp. HMF5848 TaxID=2495421 RepID=UPI000F77A6A9|nr:metal ABC transporter permease [Bacillus sp. HMF5848]RSK28273.1 metal ABC transporter permease [Bacillus sp. HMF5848]
MQEWFLYLLDANTQWVLIGTTLLGLASGVLGSFSLLRKQSLIGDAVAHAALPGICIAFLIIQSKSLILFLLGAAISGLIATFFIEKIIQHSRIKEDTALGLILSVFFGVGIVLLTYINQNASGNQSGLDDFIFGQAASLVGEDVRLITGVSAVLVFITFAFFKEFKLLTFDPQFAKGIGLPIGFFNNLLMTLIVCAVVIGLQAVGVVLMAAMLITPAIAARYWTDKLDKMVIIAGGIGAVSGMLGTFLSLVTKGMPTGPVIIVAATIIFIISLTCAPHRGLIAKAYRRAKLSRSIARENMLQTFYDLSEEACKESVNGYANCAFSIEDIQVKRKLSRRLIVKMASEAENKGLLYRITPESWRLTEKGLQEAHNLTLEKRLVDIYLMHEMQFPTLSIRDNHSFRMTDLPEKTYNQLRKLLKEHGREPILIAGDGPRINRSKDRGQTNGV